MLCPVSDDNLDQITLQVMYFLVQINWLSHIKMLDKKHILCDKLPVYVDFIVSFRYWEKLSIHRPSYKCTVINFIFNIHCKFDHIYFYTDYGKLDESQQLLIFNLILVIKQHLTLSSHKKQMKGICFLMRYNSVSRSLLSIHNINMTISFLLSM